jgi:orotidine-5'-phosphate decarboxylase
MTKIIQRDKSIIPACDVSLKKFDDLVRLTHDIDGIGGYKIPARSGKEGWEKWIATARTYTNKPLIYDHQKAGNDIPDIGKEFMSDLKDAGFNAVILFPYTSPVTEYEWILAAQENGLGVIVGGEMTHPRNLEGDISNPKGKDYLQTFRDLGIENLTGYIRKTAPMDIYELAVKMGVEDFVVPGNKPDKIQYYKQLLETFGVKNPRLYSPGLVAQGGNISESGKSAGDFWHAIIGRGICGAEDMRKAALEHTSQL